MLTATFTTTTRHHASIDPDDAVRQLPEQLRPAIEAAVVEANDLCRLPERLVKQLRDTGAFRLYTPKEFGGWETDLSSALTIYEQFGRVDPSTAWVVWNANFGFLAAMLDPVAAAQVWTPDEEPVFANSGVPGTATPMEGGFRLSGTWPIVSGIDSATWFVPLAIVHEGDQPRMTPGGQPDIRLVLVPRDQYTIKPAWNVTGLRGSGSNNVTIDNVFVSEEFAVPLEATPRNPSPTYRLGPVPLVYAGCTAIVLGTAAQAIDELVALARTKQHFGRPLAQDPRVHAAVARTEVTLQAARELLFSVARRLDRLAEHDEPIPMELRAQLHGAMAHSANSARQALVTMYELGSSSSIYRDSPIERLHRDGMVALQHANQSSAFFDAVGRVRLGLEHGMPMF
jgi:alkylation response protein AidB-like acyl-CoA dehydrogenase